MISGDAKKTFVIVLAAIAALYIGNKVLGRLP